MRMELMRMAWMMNKSQQMVLEMNLLTRRRMT